MMVPRPRPGTGESLNEVPATGMQWPETKERFARLQELGIVEPGVAGAEPDLRQT